MELNSQQASVALGDIRQAQRKVAIFTGYQHAAPHFWLWGLIWLIGYSVTDQLPQYTAATWLVLNLIGFTTGAWLAKLSARAASRPGDDGQHLAGREVLSIGLAFALFIAATFVLFSPTPTQYGAFPALLVGFAYTVVGIFWGGRWLAAGVCLSLLTMIGYLFVPHHFMLWMAVFGGGTLIASGFWMKAY